MDTSVFLVRGKNFELEAAYIRCMWPYPANPVVVALLYRPPSSMTWFLCPLYPLLERPRVRSALHLGVHSGSGGINLCWFEQIIIGVWHVATVASGLCPQQPAEATKAEPCTALSPLSDWDLPNSIVTGM